MNQPILERVFADIPIFEYAQVDSTHEIARSLLESGRLGSTDSNGDLGAQQLFGVVSASHQTKGRGRRDRKWESKPGSSMLATFIVKRREQNPMIDVAHIMTIVAKCITTIDAKVTLKWPNDLVVESKDFRKLGGCLTEVLENVLLIGIGVNVVSDAYSNALDATAISLEELGAQQTVNELLNQIIQVLVDKRERTKSEEQILRDYITICSTINREVHIEQISGSRYGKAIGIDPDGSLVLELVSGEKLSIAEGDVVHVR